MWGTAGSDAGFGVTYGGCTADIHGRFTYSHAGPSAGRNGTSSDCNHSSRGNQADSHRNTGTSAYRAGCGAYRCHDGGRSGGCGIHHSQ